MTSLSPQIFEIPLKPKTLLFLRGHSFYHRFKQSLQCYQCLGRLFSGVHPWEIGSNSEISRDPSDVTPFNLPSLLRVHSVLGPKLAYVFPSSPYFPPNHAHMQSRFWIPEQIFFTINPIIMLNANPLLTRENDDGSVADVERIPLKSVKNIELCTSS